LCADLTTFVPGWRLEDDGNILVRYKGGPRGIAYASQISVGEENDLNIRVYGTQASLEWHQENPNELLVKYPNAPRKIVRRGNDYVSDVAKRFTRLPWGHPEAFYRSLRQHLRRGCPRDRSRSFGKTDSERNLAI
jgi:predicted dehydrogenase